MMIYHLSHCNLIYTELPEGGKNWLFPFDLTDSLLAYIYIYSTGPHLRIWFRKKVMISNLSKFQGNCVIIMLTIIPPVTHHILLAPQSLNLSTNHGVNKVGVFWHSLVVFCCLCMFFLTASFRLGRVERLPYFARPPAFACGSGCGMIN